MNPTQIRETLKSLFLFSFRTGNIVLDTLLTGIIIRLSTHFHSLANTMASWDILRSLLTWLTHKKVNTIVITGKQVQGEQNTRLEYSTNFFALFHQIKQLDCANADICQLSEVPVQQLSQGSNYNRYKGGGRGTAVRGTPSKGSSPTSL